MNPMINQASQTRMQSVTQDAKGMMAQVQTAANPNMMLSQLTSRNPLLQQVMQIVQENGGNAQAAFYKKAQELGANPNTVLSLLNS